jgi:hypothetical protein
MDNKAFYEIKTSFGMSANEALDMVSNWEIFNPPTVVIRAMRTLESRLQDMVDAYNRLEEELVVSTKRVEELTIKIQEIENGPSKKTKKKV